MLTGSIDQKIYNNEQVCLAICAKEIILPYLQLYLKLYFELFFGSHRTSYIFLFSIYKSIYIVYYRPYYFNTLKICELKFQLAQLIRIIFKTTLWSSLSFSIRVLLLFTHSAFYLAYCFALFVRKREA